MLKFMIKTFGGVAVMVAVSIIGNVLLLRWQPLSYFYTAPGLLISGAVALVEAAIFWPLSIWWIGKVNMELDKEEER